MDHDWNSKIMADLKHKVTIFAKRVYCVSNCMNFDSNEIQIEDVPQPVESGERRLG